MSNLSSFTVEIAFKRRKQAINYQCWCGVNYVEQLRFDYAREVVISLT